MSCKECLERREKVVNAVLQGRILEAAKQAAKGAAEMIVRKPKGDAQSVEKPVLRSK